MKYFYKTAAFLIIISLFSCSTQRPVSESGSPETAVKGSDEVSSEYNPDDKQADESTDIADADHAADTGESSGKRDDGFPDESGSSLSGKGISTEYAEKGSAAGENEVDSVLSVKSNSGKIQSESFPDNEADPVDQVAAPGSVNNAEEESYNDVSAALSDVAGEENSVESDTTPGTDAGIAEAEDGSLPVREGVQRSSGSGWARKISSPAPFSDDYASDEEVVGPGKLNDQAEDNEVLSGGELNSKDAEVLPGDRIVSDTSGKKPSGPENTGQGIVHDKGSADSDPVLSSPVSSEEGDSGEYLSAAEDVSVPETAIPAAGSFPDDSSADGSSDSISSEEKDLEINAGPVADPNVNKGVGTGFDSEEAKKDYETKASGFIEALKSEDKPDLPADSRKLSYKAAPSHSKDPGFAGNSSESAGKTVFSSSGMGISNNSDAKQGKASEKDDDKRETVFYEDPSHVTVVLAGAGWIYLGSGEAGEVELLSRNMNDGKTVFSFRAGSGKIFILNFQLQSSDGIFISREVLLKEKDAQGFPGNMNNASGKAAGSEVSGELPGSAGVSEKPADKKDNSSVSGKNEDESGSLTGEAVMLAEEDIRSLFDEALELMENGEYGEASEKLEKIRNASEKSAELDRLYYLLGQCYEKNRESRDPVKAEMYYSMVTEQFPFSTYYDVSDRRRRYLLKYFINIQ